MTAPAIVPAENPVPVDELVCVGSNHVPGCEHLAAANDRRGEVADRAAMLAVRIPVDSIQIADNIRVDVGDVGDLAASITASGVLQPIILAGDPDRPTLVAGHRRLAATKLAGLTTIPAVWTTDPKLAKRGAARTTAQLVENILRADLNPIEEAEALRAILKADPGLTQAKLAAQLGRSAPWISNALRILEAPKPVRELVAAGKLTGSAAKAIVGLPSKQANALAKRAVEQKLGSDSVEREAKWERERLGDLERRTKATQAAAEKAIAALEAAKVAKTVPVVVSTPWDLDGDDIVEAVKVAGYTVAEGWAFPGRPAGCDCTTMRVTIDAVGYAKGTVPRGVEVGPACLSDEHRNAGRLKADAERREKEQERQRERDELQAAIAQVLTSSKLEPTLLRLIVRGFDGYSGKAWTEYVKRPDAELIRELAGRLSRSGTAYEGASLPIKGVVASLTGKQPIKAPKAEAKRAQAPAE